MKEPKKYLVKWVKRDTHTKAHHCEISEHPHWEVSFPFLVAVFQWEPAVDGPLPGILSLMGDRRVGLSPRSHWQVRTAIQGGVRQRGRWACLLSLLIRCQEGRSAWVPLV